MRPFLLLLAGVVLAGVGQGVSARSVVVSNSNYNVVARGDGCYDVADAYFGVIQAANPSFQYRGYFCGFSGAGVVNEVAAYQFNGITGAYVGVSSAGVGLSFYEDHGAVAGEADVAAVALQRVAVLVGCALMFGIGMVVGKA